MDNSSGRIMVLINDSGTFAIQNKQIKTNELGDSLLSLTSFDTKSWYFISINMFCCLLSSLQTLSEADPVYDYCYLSLTSHFHSDQV